MRKRLTLIGVTIDEMTGRAELEINGVKVLTNERPHRIMRLTLEELQDLADGILEEERGGER